MYRLTSTHTLAAFTAVVALVTGCSTGGVSDSLAQAERVAASCPPDGARIAALVQVDWSGSRRSLAATPAEEQVVRAAAERALICGGHLRMTVFSGSMIAVTVFDANLHLDGATTNARLRKAPKAVDAVMAQVTSAFPEAIERISDGATDIVAQYQLGEEYWTQLSATDHSVLEQTIVTDGIQTAGQDLSDPSLTIAHAEALAAAVSVPDLTGATVRLIGIGRQADDASLPTPYIAALRAFHTTVCDKTGADCSVVTDAAGA
ncbi:uncharacterized protein PO1_contig_020_10 [Mycobacterium sp. PO1]|nr:uncharacterized protein PO1_contig_020_10 [Mycobacterium sp. PO1]GFM24684.1 uncharacterized protein PO2_contig-046-12 [Mycobacterium sp. PO2]